MSGLEIFEELRFMIELLAAELMFIYYFAKKKGRYNIRMVCGFSGFCVLAVVYISIGFQQMMYVVSVGWYVLLLLLSMLFMKLCFEITVSDMLFIGISGYATMHIEYVVVNEILALGLWKELREILWLYIIISIASCIVWYTLVINIFVRKLQSCEGRLYEDTKANIVMFSILFLSMLIATFNHMVIDHNRILHFIDISSDFFGFCFFQCMELVFHIVTFMINNLNIFFRQLILFLSLIQELTYNLLFAI